MSPIVTNLAAARASALILPARDLETLVVTGKDRLTWLNGLVTCEIVNAKPGDAIYGLALSQKGRILSDVTAVVGDARVVIAVPSAHRDELLATWERYLIMEDAEIAKGTDAVTRVHGPRSLHVLDAARGAGATGATLDRTGLGGGIVLASADGAGAIEAAIDRVIAAIGGARGDAAAWDALRVERGVPEFGRDFGPATYPQEVGLEKSAVSFSKGCYLGQEVVCMLEMRGHVKRKLVKVSVEGETSPSVGAEALDAAGGAVGEVTTVSPTHEGGAFVALAMVKRAVAEVGAELRVGGAAARVLAIV